ncbi:MAG: hypothetical protein QOJ99_2779 [Bryobacterales bacterium]|jgi:hypothetical protein|nr:hypothetical protein [Bryobacterales bacterium]
MHWHDIATVDRGQLDHLAATYGLHSLHNEDCRAVADGQKRMTAERIFSSSSCYQFQRKRQPRR